MLTEAQDWALRHVVLNDRAGWAETNPKVVARLVASGLIERDGNSYRTTPEGNAVYLYHGRGAIGTRVTAEEMTQSIVGFVGRVRDRAGQHKPPI